MEVLAQLPVVQDVGVTLTEVPGGDEETGGAARRIADDVGRCGAVSSTISRMMWRGVRNCPFYPAVAILPSMYS